MRLFLRCAGVVGRCDSNVTRREVKGMAGKLDGKGAIVTGASSGMGEATA